ncbi:hypothetical protein AVEN_38307-1, partial [Araneus ventricosus]
ALRATTEEAVPQAYRSEITTVTILWIKNYHINYDIAIRAHRTLRPEITSAKIAPTEGVNLNINAAYKKRFYERHNDFKHDKWW